MRFRERGGSQGLYISVGKVEVWVLAAPPSPGLAAVLSRPIQRGKTKRKAKKGDLSSEAMVRRGAKMAW